MKRELKAHSVYGRVFALHPYRKAHPDEKGTERATSSCFSDSEAKVNRKAHPDEKGTER